MRTPKQTRGIAGPAPSRSEAPMTSESQPPSVRTRRRIAVALQGGGAHGAFTWGVLDRLLAHPDFEIVGISFDQKKEQLTKFTAEKKMEWPQYFDGKGWANQFGKEYGINSIPTMWLIDKKGNLRDVEARDGLEGKIEKLLAEK